MLSPRPWRDCLYNSTGCCQGGERAARIRIGAGGARWRAGLRVLSEIAAPGGWQEA